MKINNTRGLTLIEIIIALAMLGIILITFLTSFSSGVVTIFGMGHKTRAMNEAQQIIDKNDFTGLVQYFDYNTMINTAYNSAVDQNGRYFIDTGKLTPQIGTVPTGSHDVVTIMIFIKNGQDYITLTTYSP